MTRNRHLDPFHFLMVCGLSLIGGGLVRAEEEVGRDDRVVVCRQGDAGVHTFRIPGLVTTDRGTLIAVFDVRHKSAADLPGDIDVGVMRSWDDGRTWTPPQTALDFDREEAGARGNGVGDPAIVFDAQTKTLILVGLWSHGDRAWRGSGPGLAPDETGQVVITRSVDDGVTWSAPESITSQVKQPEWRLFFQGPGAGVQTSTGALVFAGQFRDAEGVVHSCLLASEDHGTTWSVTAPAVPKTPPTSEAQVAETSDGKLLLTMRNESGAGRRVWSIFNPKEKLTTGSWSDSWLDLPDPTCMASLVRHSSGALVFANPNSSKARAGLTIRVSRDDGKSWSAGRLVDARPSAYSCLTVLQDGSIGILYECGDKHPYETLTFTRIAWDTLQ
jgi:sialidase-1